MCPLNICYTIALQISFETFNESLGRSRTLDEFQATEAH